MLSVATIISLAAISPAVVKTLPALIEFTATPNLRSLISFAIAADSAPTPARGSPGLPPIKVLIISKPAGAEIFARSVR